MPSLTARLVPFLAGIVWCSSWIAASAAQLAPVATMQVPGQALVKFDIGATNPQRDLYALADRSNASVDFFDTASRRFVWRVTGFAGNGTGGSGTAGPNGVAFVGDGQLWAGDGDSSVKVIALATHRTVASIATGGRKRVDELAYDPQDKLVLAANNADRPAFVTLISTQAPYRVLARITMPRATSGIEQPVWDPVTRLFYIAVPVLDGKAAQGGIAVLNPRTRRLLHMDPVADCQPAGLALGPDQSLLAGCSDDAVAHGFPAQSIVLNTRTGGVISVIHKVGGSDEVAYDAKDHTYDLAAVANPGGPVLGIIDAVTKTWDANLRSGPAAHSVAVDDRTGDAFVPIAGGATNRLCPSGCIRVYAPRPDAAGAPR